MPTVANRHSARQHDQMADECTPSGAAARNEFVADIDIIMPAEPATTAKALPVTCAVLLPVWVWVALGLASLIRRVRRTQDFSINTCQITHQQLTIVCHPSHQRVPNYLCDLSWHHSRVVCRLHPPDQQWDGDTDRRRVLHGSRCSRQWTTTGAAPGTGCTRAAAKGASSASAFGTTWRRPFGRVAGRRRILDKGHDCGRFHVPLALPGVERLGQQRHRDSRRLSTRSALGASL